MSKQSLAQFLDLVEHKFNGVSALLVAGDAEQLPQHCEALQHIAMELAQLLQRGDLATQLTHAVGLRVLALAQGVSELRGQLLRRAAYVDQALAIVVPTETKSTYGKSSSPYGTVTRQSGAFKVLAA